MTLPMLHHICTLLRKGCPNPVHEALLLKPIIVIPKESALATVTHHEPQALTPMLSRIKKAYEQDHITRETLSSLTQGSNADGEYILDQGLLYSQGRLLILHNIDIKRDILSACHDTPYHDTLPSRKHSS
jgi:hypothetical protein